MPGRTWVIAPDAASLSERWNRLVREKDTGKKELLFHPHLRGGEPGDKHVNKVVAKGLAGHPVRTQPMIRETNTAVLPTRYAYRTLDRQWLIPDARVINQPNPTLWDNHSEQQIYFTALARVSPESGPAITVTALIPDHDHFMGSFAGRVYPLFRDAAANIPNIKPTLLAHLATVLGQPVSPEDVMAYLAAVMAHPAFTARFARDLVRPGLRVPLTADAAIFAKAAALGREVIWLHTYGERFADPAAKRPAGAPRLPKAKAPTIPKSGAIPGAPEPLPETMTYDAAKQRLHIGQGYVENVPPAVWAYDVSGMNVLKQWFSYRRRDRSRPIIGDRRPPSPLGLIQPDHWLAEYTDDLIDLLNVLGRLVELEPAQAELLEEILAGKLLDHANLIAAGALEPGPATMPVEQG